MLVMTNVVLGAGHSVGGFGIEMARSDLSRAVEIDGHWRRDSRPIMDNLETAAGADGVRCAVAHELGHQVGGMGIESHEGHEGEYLADAYGAYGMYGAHGIEM